MTITLQIQMDVWKPHGASFTSFCSRVKIHPLLTDIRSCSSNSLSSHKNCLSVLWEDPRPPETAWLHLLSTINSFFPEQSRPFLLPPNYNIIFPVPARTVLPSACSKQHARTFLRHVGVIDPSR